MKPEAIAAVAVASTVGTVLVGYAAVLLKRACCPGTAPISIDSEPLV